MYLLFIYDLLFIYLLFIYCFFIYCLFILHIAGHICMVIPEFGLTESAPCCVRSHTGSGREGKL